MGEFNPFGCSKKNARVRCFYLGFAWIGFLTLGGFTNSATGSKFPDFAEAASVSVSDSIRLDGRVIHVDAQIRIDSVLPGKHQAAQVTPKFFQGIQGSVYRGGGIISGGNSIQNWTGASDWMETLQLSAVQIPFRNLPRTSSFDAMQLKVDVGMGAMQFVSADQALLSDSVIGFLSSKDDGQFAAVTYEQFPIGIETDTILVQPVRHQIPMVLILGGWSGTFRNGWKLSVLAGGKRNLKESSRLGFERPNLYSSNPWYVIQMPSVWESVVQFEAGYVLSTADRNSWSWEVSGQSVVYGMVWKLPWIGVGLRLNRQS